MLHVVGRDDQRDDRENHGQRADEDPVAPDRAGAARADAGVQLEESGDHSPQRDDDQEHRQAAIHPDQRRDARGNRDDRLDEEHGSKDSARAGHEC